jgi:hypothetical protein
MSSSTSFGSGVFGSGGLGSAPFFNTSQLIDAVLYATAHSTPATETTKRRAILQFINNTYQKVCVGQQWRWLIASYDYNLRAPYTTGTVDATLLDATITGTGTAWNANIDVKDKFWLNGSSQIYSVASLTSNTALELETTFSEDSSTDAGYTIAKSQYKLPKETDHLLEVVLDQGRSSRRRLAPVGLSDFRDISSRNSAYTGTPEIYTLNRRETDDDFVYVEFWPFPDRAYNIHIDYLVRILQLEDSTSSYPIVPDRYRALLYYGALAEFLNNFIRDPERAMVAEKNYNIMWTSMASDKQMTDQRPILDASRNYRKRGTGRGRYFYSIEEFAKID